MAANEKPATKLSSEQLAEEARLIKNYKRGDGGAGAALLKMHWGLICGYVAGYVDRGVPTEDLEQEARIGFLHGVKKYDPANFDTRLTTYVMHHVQARLQRTIAGQSHIVRPSYGVQEKLQRARKQGLTTADELRSSGLFSAHIVDSAARFILTPRDVSFDGCREDAASLADTLASDDPIVDDEYSDHELRGQRNELVREAFASAPLTEQQREVFKRRVLADEPETLRAIGKGIGVSRERVRQVEKKARLIVEETIREMLLVTINGDLIDSIVGEDGWDVLDQPVVQPKPPKRYGKKLGKRRGRPARA